MKPAFVALLMFLQASSPAVEHNEGDTSVRTDTESFSRKLAREPLPPKLIERRKELRAIQRAGFARTRTELEAQDIFMAFLSFIKTQLTVEHSISHRSIAVYLYPNQPTRQDTINALVTPYAPRLPEIPPEPFEWEFNINYRFPDDPWKKD